MAIECYEGTCEFHGTKYGDEGPFCNEEECRNPTPIIVDCPYCGRKLVKDKIEAPVDYCHHD